MNVVAALLHRRIVLRRPVKKQELGRHRERLELGLEAGQDHPQDRQENQKSEQPRRGRGHPHASRSYLACHRLRLQIPSDDPHQEEGHDIGDHDRDQSAGGGVADVELDQRLRVDQERDIGGLQARAAAGRDEDLGEHGQQEYRFDQDHHRDRPREVRQGEIDERRKRARAVHLGRFLLLLVLGLQRREQDEGRKRQPLPGDDQDHREQGRIGEPVDRRRAEQRRDPGKQSGDRMHQQVLPDQRADGRHHEERRDHHQPDDAAPDHRLVEQQRQRRAEQDGDGQDRTDQHQRVPQRGQKGRVGQKISKILQPDEALGVRIQQAVVQRRKIDRHRQRDDHPDEQQCDGRSQQGPSENLCLLRCHRRLLLSWRNSMRAAVRS